MNTKRLTALQETLEKYMTDEGYNMKQLSLEAGLNETAVRDILRGRVQSPSYRTLEKLAHVLGCRTEELAGHAAPSGWGVPVVGYVGAGAQVYPIDDYPLGEGMYEADPPPNLDPRALVAVEVKGDSMLPVMRGGWLIYYRKECEGITEDCLNTLCVVKVKDGPMLVKELKRGYRTGTFNLFSYNADLMEDVALEWAARVLFIKPN